jgi:hypothetical protein
MRRDHSDVVGARAQERKREERHRKAMGGCVRNWNSAMKSEDDAGGRGDANCSDGLYLPHFGSVTMLQLPHKNDETSLVRA